MVKYHVFEYWSYEKQIVIQILLYVNFTALLCVLGIPFEINIFANILLCSIMVLLLRSIMVHLLWSTYSGLLEFNFK